MDNSGVAEQTDLKTIMPDLLRGDDLMPSSGPEQMLNPGDPEHLLFAEDPLCFLEPWDFWNPPFSVKIDGDPDTLSLDDESSVGIEFSQDCNEDSDPQDPSTVQKREKIRQKKRLYWQNLKKKNTLFTIIRKHPLMLDYMKQEIRRMNETKRGKFTFDNMPNDIKVEVRVDLEKEGFTFDDLKGVTQKMLERMEKEGILIDDVVKEGIERKDIQAQKKKDYKRRWVANLSETHRRDILEKQRTAYRNRRATEPKDQRDDRLEKKRTAERNRLAKEPKDKRDDRLEKKRTAERNRLAKEPKEKRDARLEKKRVYMQNRRAEKT